MLGDNIVITVVDARGDSIKIGIDAPKEVSIYREEIYLEIKAANQKAKEAPKPDTLKAVTAMLPNKTVNPNKSQ